MKSVEHGPKQVAMTGRENTAAPAAAATTHLSKNCVAGLRQLPIRNLGCAGEPVKKL
jgi:hypothetical protein